MPIPTPGKNKILFSERVGKREEEEQEQQQEELEEEEVTVHDIIEHSFHGPPPPLCVNNRKGDPWGSTRGVMGRRGEEEDVVVEPSSSSSLVATGGTTSQDSLPHMTMTTTLTPFGRGFPKPPSIPFYYGRLHQFPRPTASSSSGKHHDSRYRPTAGAHLTATSSSAGEGDGGPDSGSGGSTGGGGGWGTYLEEKSGNPRRVEGGGEGERFDSGIRDPVETMIQPAAAGVGTGSSSLHPFFRFFSSTPLLQEPAGGGGGKGGGGKSVPAAGGNGDGAPTALSSASSSPSSLVETLYHIWNGILTTNSSADPTPFLPSFSSSPCLPLFSTSSSSTSSTFSGLSLEESFLPRVRQCLQSPLSAHQELGLSLLLHHLVRGGGEGEGGGMGKESDSPSFTLLSKASSLLHSRLWKSIRLECAQVRRRQRLEQREQENKNKKTKENWSVGVGEEEDDEEEEEEGEEEPGKFEQGPSSFFPLLSTLLSIYTSATRPFTCVLVLTLLSVLFHPPRSLRVGEEEEGGIGLSEKKSLPAQPPQSPPQLGKQTDGYRMEDEIGLCITELRRESQDRELFPPSCPKDERPIFTPGYPISLSPSSSFPPLVHCRGGGGTVERRGRRGTRRTVSNDEKAKEEEEEQEDAVDRSRDSVAPLWTLSNFPKHSSLIRGYLFFTTCSPSRCSHQKREQNNKKDEKNAVVKEGHEKMKEKHTMSTTTTRTPTTTRSNNRDKGDFTKVIASIYYLSHYYHLTDALLQNIRVLLGDERDLVGEGTKEESEEKEKGKVFCTRKDGWSSLSFSPSLALSSCSALGVYRLPSLSSRTSLVWQVLLGAGAGIESSSALALGSSRWFQQEVESQLSDWVLGSCRSRISPTSEEVEKEAHLHGGGASSSLSLSTTTTPTSHLDLDHLCRLVPLLLLLRRVTTSTVGETILRCWCRGGREDEEESFPTGVKGRHSERKRKQTTGEMEKNAYRYTSDRTTTTNSRSRHGSSAAPKEQKQEEEEERSLSSSSSSSCLDSSSSSTLMETVKLFFIRVCALREEEEDKGKQERKKKEGEGGAGTSAGGGGMVASSSASCSPSHVAAVTVSMLWMRDFLEEEEENAQPSLSRSVRWSVVQDLMEAILKSGLQVGAGMVVECLLRRSVFHYSSMSRLTTCCGRGIGDTFPFPHPQLCDPHPTAISPFPYHHRMDHGKVQDGEEEEEERRAGHIVSPPPPSLQFLFHECALYSLECLGCQLGTISTIATHTTSRSSNPTASAPNAAPSPPSTYSSSSPHSPHFDDHNEGRRGNPSAGAGVVAGTSREKEEEEGSEGRSSNRNHAQGGRRTSSVDCSPWDWLLSTVHHEYLCTYLEVSAIYESAVEKEWGGRREETRERRKSREREWGSTGEKEQEEEEEERREMGKGENTRHQYHHFSHGGSGADGAHHTNDHIVPLCRWEVPEGFYNTLIQEWLQKGLLGMKGKSDVITPRTTSTTSSASTFLTVTPAEMWERLYSPWLHPDAYDGPPMSLYPSCPSPCAQEDGGEVDARKGRSRKEVVEKRGEGNGDYCGRDEDKEGNNVASYYYHSHYQRRRHPLDWVWREAVVEVHRTASGRGMGGWLERAEQQTTGMKNTPMGIDNSSSGNVVAGGASGAGGEEKEAVVVGIANSTGTSNNTKTGMKMKVLSMLSDQGEEQRVLLFFRSALLTAQYQLLSIVTHLAVLGEVYGPPLHSSSSTNSSLWQDEKKKEENTFDAGAGGATGPATTVLRGAFFTSHEEGEMEKEKERRAGGSGRVGGTSGGGGASFSPVCLTLLHRVHSSLLLFTERCYCIPNNVETRLGRGELNGAVAAGLSMGRALLSYDFWRGSLPPFSSTPVSSDSSSSSSCFFSLRPFLRAYHLCGLFLIQSLLKSGRIKIEEEIFRLALRSLFLGFQEGKVEDGEGRRGQRRGGGRDEEIMKMPKDKVSSTEESGRIMEEKMEAVKPCDSGWSILMDAFHHALFPSSSTPPSYASLLLTGPPRSWVLAPFASWCHFLQEERLTEEEEEEENPHSRSRRRVAFLLMNKSYENALRKWSRWVPYMLSLDPRVGEVMDTEGILMHWLSLCVSASSLFSFSVSSSTTTTTTTTIEELCLSLLTLASSCGYIPTWSLRERTTPPPMDKIPKPKGKKGDEEGSVQKRTKGKTREETEEKEACEEHREAATCEFSSSSSNLMFSFSSSGSGSVVGGDGFPTKFSLAAVRALTMQLSSRVQPHEEAPLYPVIYALLAVVLRRILLGFFSSSSSCALVPRSAISSSPSERGRGAEKAEEEKTPRGGGNEESHPQRIMMTAATNHHPPPPHPPPPPTEEDEAGAAIREEQLETHMTHLLYLLVNTPVGDWEKKQTRRRSRGRGEEKEEEIKKAQRDAVRIGGESTSTMRRTGPSLCSGSREEEEEEAATTTTATTSLSSLWFPSLGPALLALLLQEGMGIGKGAETEIPTKRQQQNKAEWCRREEEGGKETEEEIGRDVDSSTTWKKKRDGGGGDSESSEGVCSIPPPPSSHDCASPLLSMPIVIKLVQAIVPFFSTGRKGRRDPSSTTGWGDGEEDGEEQERQSLKGSNVPVAPSPLEEGGRGRRGIEEERDAFLPPPPLYSSLMLSYSTTPGDDGGGPRRAGAALLEEIIMDPAKGLCNCCLQELLNQVLVAYVSGAKEQRRRREEENKQQGGGRGGDSDVVSPYGGDGSLSRVSSGTTTTTTTMVKMKMGTMTTTKGGGEKEAFHLSMFESAVWWSTLEELQWFPEILTSVLEPRGGGGGRGEGR